MEPILFGLAFFIVGLVVYGFHPLRRWQYRHIPGPKPVWLFGNLLDVLKDDLPRLTQKWAQQYGPVYKMWQGGRVMIVVEDPIAARTVNMHNHARPPILSPFSGQERESDMAGILMAEGPYWQALRQTWQSVFHPSSLQEYCTLINASAGRLCNILGAAADSGKVVEIWRLFGALTMEVVGSAAFGVELRTLEGSQIIQADPKQTQLKPGVDSTGVTIQKCAAVMFAFAGPTSTIYSAFAILFPDFAPVIRWFATNLPDYALRCFLQARHVLRDVSYELIEQTQRELDDHKRGVGQSLQAGSKKRGPLPAGSFLSNLLEAENKLIGRKFTRMEVASQANTFLLAGYETTASALAFTVYHIAQHADKEANMLAEIDAFGRDKSPTVQDLDQFPYTRAVFAETLRLTPPAAFGTIRVAREDFTVCGVRIPKGAFLNTAQLSYQNNPKYWPDADKFQPERFLTDRGTDIPAFAPFGEGGRSCVGMRLAQAEAVITLVRLYQRFTLRLVAGQVPLKTVTTITMSPGKDGVRVTVHPRS